MTAMTEAKPLIESLESYIAPDIGSDEEVARKLEALTQLYENDPWRAYHTVKHLEEMAGFLKASEDELHNPAIVFGAMLGHDSVYEPWLYSVPGANEELSLKRTNYFLSPHFSLQTIEKMSQYIRATAQHPSDSSDTDLAYFLDADMRILGADPERFSEYENNIFTEFTWLGALTRKQYLVGRLKFIRSIEHKRIFSTEIGQDLYEEQAHRNLAALAFRHMSELNEGDL